MNIAIEDDHITIHGSQKVDKKRFEEYANRLGHREWHVGSASGIMSWTEYYESDLLEGDLVAFLAKDISSSDTKKADAYNPR